MRSARPPRAKGGSCSMAATGGAGWSMPSPPGAVVRGISALSCGRVSWIRVRSASMATRIVQPCGLPPEAVGRAIDRYLAVFDDAAFGAATEITSKFARWRRVRVLRLDPGQIRRRRRFGALPCGGKPLPSRPDAPLRTGEISLVARPAPPGDGARGPGRRFQQPI